MDAIVNTNQGPMTQLDAVDHCLYSSYRYNRATFNISAERLAQSRLFGEQQARDFEARYQLEQRLKEIAK